MAELCLSSICANPKKWTGSIVNNTGQWCMWLRPVLPALEFTAIAEEHMMCTYDNNYWYIMHAIWGNLALGDWSYIVWWELGGGARLSLVLGGLGWGTKLYLTLKIEKVQLCKCTHEAKGWAIVCCTKYSKVDASRSPVLLEDNWYIKCCDLTKWQKKTTI